MSPFDFVNAINGKKQDIIRTSDNPDLMEKQYNAHTINRAFSHFIDTILYSNEMNKAYHIDSKLQNDYYLNSIRSGKRFSKWHKRQEDQDIECIQEYYKVNYLRASEIVKLLSKEQLNLIKIRITKGGNNELRSKSAG